MVTPKTILNYYKPSLQNVLNRLVVLKYLNPLIYVGIVQTCRKFDPLIATIYVSMK